MPRGMRCHGGGRASRRWRERAVPGRDGHGRLAPQGCARECALVLVVVVVGRGWWVAGGGWWMVGGGWWTVGGGWWMVGGGWFRGWEGGGWSVVGGGWCMVGGGRGA